MQYWDYKKQKPDPSINKLLSLQKQIEEKNDELDKLKAKKEELEKLIPPKQTPEKPKHEKQKLSDDEELFNTILNAAYELIMEKSGKNKLKALGIFNTHQEHILGKCEDILNLVKSGQINRNTINGRLKQMVDI